MREKEQGTNIMKVDHRPKEIAANGDFKIKYYHTIFPLAHNGIAQPIFGNIRILPYNTKLLHADKHAHTHTQISQYSIAYISA